MYCAGRGVPNHSAVRAALFGSSCVECWSVVGISIDPSREVDKQDQDKLIIIK